MKTWCLTGLALLLIGCDAAKEAVQVNEADTNVLASVDGVCYTLAQRETDVAITLELAKIEDPRIKSGALKKKEEAVRAESVQKFVNRQVAFKEARRRKIDVGDGELAAFHRQFAKTIDQSGKLSYADILARLPGNLSKSLERDLRGDLVFQKVMTGIAAEVKAQTEKLDIEKSYQHMLAYNKTAREREREIFLQATNAWRRIAAGEDFVRVGQEISASNAYIKVDADWGSFELEYFKDDVEFCRLLSGAKKGSLLPPTPADNGLIIAKVTDYEQPSFEEGSVHPKYQLAMIFFALPEIAEVNGKDDFAEQYKRVMGGQFLREKMNQLRSTCKIFQRDESQKPKGPRK